MVREGGGRAEHARHPRQGDGVEPLGVEHGREDAEVGGRPELAHDEERIPFRGLRARISEKMVRSKFTAPHFTAEVQIDGVAPERGHGANKRAAEQAAARKREEDERPPVDLVVRHRAQEIRG